jgi:hypothetical protein
MAIAQDHMADFSWTYISEKYVFYSCCFDMTRAWTHDILHSWLTWNKFLKDEKGI